MKAIKAMLVLFTFCTVSAHPQKETAFIASHLADESLCTVLDEHSELLITLVKAIHKTPYQKHGVWKFDWLPGYYVKYNIKRLLMRERLASCIENYSLDLLHTPPKYLYHLKGRPQELHNLNYVIIAEEVHADPASEAEPMSREQIIQCITLIEKTGHCSTYAHNYLRLEKGKISFIDTDGTFNRKNPIRGIIDLLNRNLDSYYTPEALIYCIDRIAAHLICLKDQDFQTAEKRIALILKDQKKEVSLKIAHLLKERCHAHRHKKSRNSSSSAEVSS